MAAEGAADPPGRRYRHAARVGLGDAAPDGRARFDALARWLQDAAYCDVVDAGLATDGAWIVRRSELRVERFPRLPEALELMTWCSGLGRTRMWAQRRTSLRGDAGARVEADALWVHLDPASGRPLPLSPAQLAAWEPSAQGRVVRARLTHPGPPADADPSAWTFRAADLDVAGHVNNAAYWTVLEEALAAGPPAEPALAEIEHRAAAAAGPVTVRRAGELTWIGDVCASIRLDGGRTLAP